MYVVQIAFRKYNVRLGVTGSPWVGLKYFEKYLTDAYFWKVVRNTLLLNVYSLLFSFPAPIILALLLNELKSKAFFLHLIQYADGLLGSPRLVGINANPDVRAYGIPDSGKTLYIQRRIDSDLGL